MRSSTTHAPISTGWFGPGVLDRVVEQVHQRAAHLAAVAGDLDVGRLRARRGAAPRPASAAACTRSTRLRDEQPDRHRCPRRRLLRLDRAEVEQVVDDARQPVGLAHDPIGEPLHDRDVVGRGHRLGEQPERADRRLELVTHVRDEVAPDALDPPRLRDVAGERDRADDLAVAAQRERAQLQHLAGRAVELELALGAVTRSSASCTSSAIASSASTSPVRAPAKRRADRVAHDLTADAVDDDDRVARLVERGQQPVLHRLRLQHPIVGDSRARSAIASTSDDVVGHVDRAPHAGAARARVERPARARRARRRPTRPDRTTTTRSAVTTAARRTPVLNRTDP